MKEQLADGVVQKVETRAYHRSNINQHRAVVRDDKKMTKVRIVLDESAKIKGPSLNESLHKGPLSTHVI